MISVISPIYNEEANLLTLYQRVKNILTDLVEEDHEIILVDNGSTDDSLKIIKQLRENDIKVKYISLSRNFGHQCGILAGIEHAKGDAVISIDGDLQQPPELIKQMVELWKSGYQVVYTIKKSNYQRWNLRKFLTIWFYKILSIISELSFSYGQSDYRLLDRKIIDVLKMMPERDKFLRGLVEWVGFKQTSLAYIPSERLHGNSKFSIKNYINFALNGIFSFSTAPLKIILLIGFSVSALCMIYALFALSVGIISLLDPSVNTPPGWATIAVSITFLSSIQLISIGFVGEYVIRNFNQSKLRPEYIVNESALD